MESGLATRVTEGKDSTPNTWTNFQADALWKRLVRPIPLTLVDLASLFGLFILAEYIINRSSTAMIGELTLRHGANHTAQSISFIAVSVALLWVLRFKDLSGVAPHPSGWMRIVGVVSFASMFSAFVWMLFSPNTYDHLYIVLVWTLSVLGIPLGGYIALKSIRIFQLIKPVNSHHTPVIIIGNPSTMSIAKQRFEQENDKYQLVGTLDLTDGNAKGEDSQNGSRQIDINAYANSNGGVVVVTPADKYAELTGLLKSYALADSDRVRVALYPPDDDVSDTVEVTWKPKRFSWWYEKFRRGIDLTIALSSLIIASPIILFIAALIKIDSRGPILFSQTRVGRNGQLFNMHKFRSMCTDAEILLDNLSEKNEASGQMFKIADDPRVTRVGRIIRRLSLDEIPQLLNVVQGTMSIVGPRPPLPHEVKEYEPWHFRRFEATPGITGLWQVKRGSEINFNEMVLFDIEYIDNWSLKTDASIILKTIPAMLRGQGAY